MSITGYKGFIFNTKTNTFVCRQTKFIVGQKKSLRGKLEFCSNGFHFCNYLWEVLNFYYLDSDKFYGEVVTGEDYREGCNKNISREITLKKILKTTEVLSKTNYVKNGGKKELKDVFKNSKIILFETPALYSKYYSLSNKNDRKPIRVEGYYYRKNNNYPCHGWESNYFLVTKIFNK